jgi:hypothetical protein
VHTQLVVPENIAQISVKIGHETILSIYRAKIGEYESITDS